MRIAEQVAARFLRRTSPRREAKKEDVRPYRAWGGLLLASVCGLCAVVVYALYTYVEVNRGTLVEPLAAPVHRPSTIDPAELERTLLLLRERRAETERIRAGRSNVVDPSR